MATGNIRAVGTALQKATKTLGPQCILTFITWVVDLLRRRVRYLWFNTYLERIILLPVPITSPDRELGGGKFEGYGSGEKSASTHDALRAPRHS
jgi:hypothetical protein